MKNRTRQDTENGNIATGRVMLVGDDNIYRAAVGSALEKVGVAYEIFSEPHEVNAAIGLRCHKYDLIIFVNPVENIVAMFIICELRYRRPEFPIMVFCNVANTSHERVLTDIGVRVIADGRDGKENLLKAVLDGMASPDRERLNNTSASSSRSQ